MLTPAAGVDQDEGPALGRLLRRRRSGAPAGSTSTRRAPRPVTSKRDTCDHAPVVGAEHAQAAPRRPARGARGEAQLALLPVAAAAGCAAIRAAVAEVEDVDRELPVQRARLLELRPPDAVCRIPASRHRRGRRDRNERGTPSRCAAVILIRGPPRSPPGARSSPADSDSVVDPRSSHTRHAKIPTVMRG